MQILDGGLYNISPDEGRGVICKQFDILEQPEHLVQSIGGSANTVCAWAPHEKVRAIVITQARNMIFLS